MDGFLRGGSSAAHPSVPDSIGTSPTLVEDVRQHLGQLDLRSPPSGIASTEWALEFGQLADDVVPSSLNRPDIDIATTTHHDGFGVSDLTNFNRTSVPHEMMTFGQQHSTLDAPRTGHPMRLGPSLSFPTVDGTNCPRRLPMNHPLYSPQLPMRIVGKGHPTMNPRSASGSLPPWVESDSFQLVDDPPPVTFSKHGLHPRPLSMEGKGKGRMIELNDEQWEAQFASLDRTQAQERNVATPPSSKTDAEKATRSETLVGEDVEGLWKGLISDDVTDRPDMTEYRRSQITSEEMGQSGLGDVDLLELGILGGWDAGTHPLGSYVFEVNNPLDGASQAYEFGVRVMAEGGNLSTAALAFEVAVQKAPGHVAAWIGLGNAQAQNEKETAAIRALEEALRLEPNNLTALMGLAVSYTNEGMDLNAYDVLERWLSVRYPHVVKQHHSTRNDRHDDADWTLVSRGMRQDRIRDMFISAAQISPEGEAMDPDVQVGLGILFYSVEEYDKAVDCFSAALDSTELRSSYARSQRHLLWNRLGATLANSGHSEEAIAAYEEALNLRPNFVRARYNLGVACINMGCYDVAAQHLLRGLVLHRVADKDERDRMVDFVRGRQSSPIHRSTKPAARENGLDHVPHEEDEEEKEEKKPVILEDWHNSSEILFDTLRRVLLGMGRNDLVSRVGPGMDLEAFRKEIDY